MQRAVQDFFKLGEGVVGPIMAAGIRNPAGFFRFGPDAIAYGETSVSLPPSINEPALLPDLRSKAALTDKGVVLPFDLDAIVHNLQFEKYMTRSGARMKTGFLNSGAVHGIYNLLRPLLVDRVRRELQRVYFRGWEQIAFPQWPVDTSVEILREQALALAMRSKGVTEVPFIWFWPDGAKAAAMFTHDVEGEKGLRLVRDIMDTDEQFGIRGSFQFVPEERYEAPRELLDEVRGRGFEVNVHGLNHRGNLFEDREHFLRAAEKINGYVRKFGSVGFRSPCMYRDLELIESLSVDYDMSVPNLAQLEPQRGGCCTVFPYFAGRILELPLTMVQDYSLFHILGMYTIDLWKVQMDRIFAHNGLMSFIIHPDYISEGRENEVYRELLTYFHKRAQDQGIWTALPGEINSWWRERSRMEIVQQDGRWRIQGNGSDRASLAFAVLRDGVLSYSLTSGDRAIQPQAGPPRAWSSLASQVGM